MKQKHKPFANGDSKIAPRLGKTERDKKSGKNRCILENRNKRIDWQQHGGAFPAAVCNGKDNRFQFAKGVRGVNLAKGAGFQPKKTHNGRSVS